MLFNVKLLESLNQYSPVHFMFSTDSLLAQRQRCDGHSNLRLRRTERFGRSQEASGLTGTGYPVQQSQDRAGQEGEHSCQTVLVL